MSRVWKNLHLRLHRSYVYFMKLKLTGNYISRNGNCIKNSTDNNLIDIIDIKTTWKFFISSLTFKSLFTERKFLLEFQNFLQHYSSCLSFLRNYFDSPIKLFLDLHKILDLSKFLDILAKSFFPFFISNL